MDLKPRRNLIEILGDEWETMSIKITGAVRYGAMVVRRLREWFSDGTHSYQVTLFYLAVLCDTSKGRSILVK